MLAGLNTRAAIDILLGKHDNYVMKFWLQYKSDKPVSFKVTNETKARELVRRRQLRIKGTTYRVIGLMGNDEALLEDLIPIFWEELTHFEQLRRTVERFKATGEWK